MTSTGEALGLAADCLDQVVERILSAFSTVPEPPGYYEAELEAELMLKIGMRYAEGVAGLARQGVVTYPAAMVLARATYEGAIRVLWMLAPEDPFDRESRWLASVRQTARFHEQLAGEFKSLGFEDDVVADRRVAAAKIRAFVEGVTEQLRPRSVRQRPCRR